ncbi:MAG TPA: UDP-galactose phosphate transferase [Lachnospiraceae bacterium]|jgi:lipopolysaccharide/colanic/teichoic acid biosynthesis glycosyltransferase|nr:UDP-galactose phosphate transferase [Lachnospiraceae bacterium]
MYSFIKRCLDTVGAGLGLIVLFPFLLLIALAIRMKMGGPVLFRQMRPGLRGKPFYMYKFRTMTNKRNAAGELLPDEMRLTWLGHFLRTTSLDELPELFNVLKGEMSLVGPRPLLMQYMDRYTPEQARRHEVKPGITGWAQVNGRNAISWEEKFALDVWYVDNRSLWLDIKILAITIWKVFRREGISARGEATMPEFRGSYEQEVYNEVQRGNLQAAAMKDNFC